MFTSGQSIYLSVLFSFPTFFVAIPTAIKVFTKVATLYKGHVSYTPPMMYVFTFLALFMVGGLTGVVLGALSVDVHLHDTYFVVAHFHYVMMGSIIAYIGGLHHWWPKMFGRMYPQKLANVTSIVVFISFNLTFLPMFWWEVGACRVATSTLPRTRRSTRSRRWVHSSQSHVRHPRVPDLRRNLGSCRLPQPVERPLPRVAYSDATH